MTRGAVAVLGAVAAGWIVLAVSSGLAGPLSSGEVAAVALPGAALVLTGVACGLRRPGNRTGWLLAASGAAWMLPLLRYSGDSLVWTVSLVAPVAVAPVLAHLAGAGRRLVATAYAVVLGGGLVVTSLTRDPASQGYDGFPENLLLVSEDVDAWGIAADLLTAGQAMLAGLLVIDLVRRRPQVPATLAVATAAALLIAPLLADGLHARAPVLIATPWGPLQNGLAVLAVAVAVAYAAQLLAPRLARSGVADLVMDLDQAATTDAFHGALIRVLKDPTLRLLVWAEDRARFMDADGAEVAVPTPGSGRRTTILERDGRRVGALIHDETLRRDPELIAAVGAAVRFALDNERLQAELKGQLAEVHASRKRIVEAADLERRRLERNLHDGAQQQLVSLSMAVRLAQRRASGDPELDRQLEGAFTLTRTALGEIRSLAHGLHPPVLQEEGLAVALEALAQTAPLPVRLLTVPAGRLPDAVEAASYFVTGEALANVAKHAHASTATVAVTREPGRLVVEVADDGIGGANPARGSGLRGLSDRVSAMNGRLAIDSPAGQGTRLRAEVPCE